VLPSATKIPRSSCALPQPSAPTAMELCDAIVGKGRPPVLVAAVAALADRRLADAAPSAVALLHSPARDVRIAAVATLGSIGTVAVVEALRAAAASHSPLDFELHRTVSAAIAAIQSRAQGAAAGQLSLAASASGQVSVANPSAADARLTLASGSRAVQPSDPES
jgi:HEAT repeat protein